MAPCVPIYRMPVTQGSVMHVLRTPDERFANLADYPFEPSYVTVINADGTPLRIHSVDEGPRDAPIVLLMHGEPSWSYLYRKIITDLAGRGYRVGGRHSPAVSRASWQPTPACRSARALRPGSISGCNSARASPCCRSAASSIWVRSASSPRPRSPP